MRKVKFSLPFFLSKREVGKAYTCIQVIILHRGDQLIKPMALSILHRLPCRFYFCDPLVNVHIDPFIYVGISYFPGMSKSQLVNVLHL